MPMFDTKILYLPKAKHGEVPVLGINLYADAALRDSREVFTQVRMAVQPTLMSGISRTQSGASWIVPIRPSSAGGNGPTRVSALTWPSSRCGRCCER